MYFNVDGIKVYFDEIEPKEFHSVLVVLRQDQKWLLVKNKNRGWEFPGGTRELNETFAETAIREAREESGSNIKDIKYEGYYILPHGEITIITTAQVDKREELTGGFETEEVKLFSDLPKDLSFNDGLYEFIIERRWNTNYLGERV
ncbi:NUDIX domain-containing protein [Paenibacillus medicaginis]|uniref:NUDIX domain-containing protein n=1 Tax=Paenibacillus medicaginis TaxID=1470560 RepID=A0ABV5BVS1_9BACL